MNPLRLTLAFALATSACASPSVGVGTGPARDPWVKTFDPPRALDTARVHLEPLDPEHTSLDYAALMSSRDHLQRTLHWGTWPRPNFTLEENRKDLVRHRKEFDEREAYAFTVQSTDRTRCVGCIYVNPVTGPKSNAARLSFWVIESEIGNDLDRHLLESVLDWLHRDWPFTTIDVPLRVENERGIRIARAIGLSETTVVAKDHVVFRSQETIR